MSENRIRKSNTVQPYGPASAGIWVDDDNSLKINPDGTTREVGPVIVAVQVPTATDAVDFSAFIAPVALELIGVQASFGTASTSGTLQVEKCTGTTAAGSGTDLLTGTISLAGTANTVLDGTLISTTASLQFAAGDRLALDFGGTVTNLVDLTVTLYFKQL